MTFTDRSDPIDYSLKHGDLVTSTHWTDKKGKLKPVQIVDLNWALQAAAVNLRPGFNSLNSIVVLPIRGLQKVERP